MTTSYGIIEEKYVLGSSSRISYGIAAYADAGDDGTRTIIASAHDITTDKQKLTELIDNCDRLRLSPLHLNDVVENFLDE